MWLIVVGTVDGIRNAGTALERRERWMCGSFPPPRVLHKRSVGFEPTNLEFNRANARSGGAKPFPRHACLAHGGFFAAKLSDRLL